MAKRVCGFCGKPGKISNEHLWAKWLGRLLGPANMTVEIQREDKSVTWESQDLDVQIQLPCTTCNNGWMSDLESTVEPIITPMIKPGTARALDVAHQTVLAAWMMKTAMVAEPLSPMRPHYYTPAERQFLMDRLTPPAGVRIWIGRYRGRFRCHSSADHLRSPKPGGLLLPGYCSTFAVGHLAFQVFSYRRSRGQPEYFRVRRGFWSRTLLQLYPPTRGVIMLWPPRETLIHHEFLTLAHRFVVAPRPRT